MTSCRSAGYDTQLCAVAGWSTATDIMPVRRLQRTAVRGGWLADCYMTLTGWSPAV
jgi:hypothetical protein